MEGMRSPSPTLASDPTPPRVQPFQEPFIPAPQQAPLQTSQQTSRSRAGSNARPVVHQPQPIREAVDKAFDQQSLENSNLSASFIAQVTEAVVKNLQNASLTTPVTPTVSQQAQYPPPPQPSVHSVPQSPTQSSTTSLPARYTPPSPHRNGESYDGESRGSASPEPPPSESDSTYSKDSYRSGRSRQSDRDGDTPRPAAHQDDQSQSNTSRRRVQESGQRARRREGSDSGSTTTAMPSRRDSSGSGSSQHDSTRSHVRSAKVLSPVEEATTLEKIWGPLFDNGYPTPRLGQFLRGLAIHLIDDYEPQGSLVVTPAKMLRFFDETKVADELYPWQTIFGGGMTSPSISVMYRRLLCQHHLVQLQNHDVPNVPALTPHGFEGFMTCLIQAHPDIEYNRLSQAVMNMPISNADAKRERFPKELSRRLLPTVPNQLAEQRIIASMAHETQLLQLRNITAMPPPPASTPPQQRPPSSFQERERKPYSHSSFSNAIDDEDLSASMPSMPIERERNPYHGKEGGGKKYHSDSDPDDRPNTSQWRSSEAPRPPRPNRQSSGPPPQPSMFSTSGPSDPRSVPPPNQRKRMSSGPGGPQPNQFQPGSYSKGRRSPPPRNAFARSEPVNLGDIPSSQYASNMNPSRTTGGFFDPDEEQMRRYGGRRSTAASSGNGPTIDEESRGSRPIPSRKPTHPAPDGLDSAYASANGAPPLGSYPARNRPPTDDRRRSIYNHNNMSSNPGGTDGWGSFNGNGSYPSPQPPYGNPSAQY